MPGTTTPVIAINGAAYTLVADGATIASVGVQIDSGLPVRLAVATALPAPGNNDYINLRSGLNAIDSIALRLISTDKVYVMAAAVGEASIVRTWKEAR